MQIQCSWYVFHNEGIDIALPLECIGSFFDKDSLWILHTDNVDALQKEAKFIYCSKIKDFESSGQQVEERIYLVKLDKTPEKVTDLYSKINNREYLEEVLQDKNIEYILKVIKTISQKVEKDNWYSCYFFKVQKARKYLCSNNRICSLIKKVS